MSSVACKTQAFDKV